MLATTTSLIFLQQHFVCLWREERIDGCRRVFLNLRKTVWEFLSILKNFILNILTFYPQCGRYNPVLTWKVNDNQEIRKLDKSDAKQNSYPEHMICDSEGSSSPSKHECWKYWNYVTLSPLHKTIKNSPACRSCWCRPPMRHISVWTFLLFFELFWIWANTMN